MEIQRSDEVDLTHGLVCRTSRAGTTIAGLVIAPVLCGAPVFWWSVEAPSIVWILCAGVAVICVPPILRSVIASLRSTNWLLIVRDRDIVLNFRSYANATPDNPSQAAALPFREIESAREVRESHKLPDSMHGGGTVHSKTQFLELQISPEIDTEVLRNLLVEERKRSVRERTYLGGLTVRSKMNHDPVTIPEDHVLRITWRSPRDLVVPKLQVVLDRLTDHITVTPTLEHRFARWDELDDQEFDDLVVQLAMQGRTLDAVKMLQRGRGLSATEAKKFVDELRS